jgi:hypothetical protein
MEKELRSAREEICKPKARTVNSNFMEQDNSGNWKKKKKKNNSRSHRLSANDAHQVQMNN